MGYELMDGVHYDKIVIKHVISTTSVLGYDMYIIKSTILVHDKNLITFACNPVATMLSNDPYQNLDHLGS